MQKKWKSVNVSAASSFEDIWLKFDKELTNFVRSRVYDTDIVKDIMQEVAIKIFKQQQTLREQKKLRGWLYQITKNTIIDYFRVHHKKVPDNLYYELTQNSEKDKVDEQAIEQCMPAMINRLKPKDKEVLILSSLKELSLKEVANKLHLSESGAKSRIKRSKEALASELFECCNFEKNKRGEIINYHQKDKNCKDC